MSWLYTSLLLFTMVFPTVRPYESKIQFASKWKAVWPGMIFTAAVFIIWDIIFTKDGVWGFNHKYTLGLDLFGLPIEEMLFFFIIPFACLFIYESVNAFFPSLNKPKIVLSLGWLTVVGLLVISILFADKRYTFLTSIYTALFLIYILLINPSWLTKFAVAYVLHLIPFFLINGVLTGSLISEQVVWYNNEENMSIRMGTIPIEDPIYSMLLFLMNVTFYERFKKYFSLA